MQRNGARGDDIRIVHGDCREWMRAQADGAVACAITSPPYNLGIAYDTYRDQKPRAEYLAFLDEVFGELRRVLGAQGHFFLNVGYSNADPWVDFDVAAVARKHFVLQNRLLWVKSIAIGEETFGHFKPINSPRYLNATHEQLLHLTADGTAPIDKMAVGVPYKWKSNLDKHGRARGRVAKKMGYASWSDFQMRASAEERARLDAEVQDRLARIGPARDRRCRGNTWFIPYDTIQDRELDRGAHPATFPVALPEMCIRLARLAPGSLVFDPFVGSGTTMIAARNLGMRGVGTDIDARYVAYARERLAGTRGLFGAVEA